MPITDKGYLTAYFPLLPVSLFRRNNFIMKYFLTCLAAQTLENNASKFQIIFRKTNFLFLKYFSVYFMKFSKIFKPLGNDSFLPIFFQRHDVDEYSIKNSIAVFIILKLLLLLLLLFQVDSDMSSFLCLVVYLLPFFREKNHFCCLLNESSRHCRVHYES